MKKILATAYAVNPYKGSEDGMGWNFICQIARFNKVIAITRENNQPHIDKYMMEFPNEIYENMTFLYFDLPYWMRFWKKGSKGAMIYYYLWQFNIPKFVKKQKNIKYDILHNLNFHNDWTPSRLWKLNKPFVWGPIGHHPKIPTQYFKGYKIKELLKDFFRWTMKLIFWNFDPFLKKTISNSNVILAMNKSVQQRLGCDIRKITIMPSVGSELVVTSSKNYEDVFKIISVGRFVVLKGFDITIEAFNLFYNGLNAQDKKKVHLTLVGDGPEKKRLREIIDKYELDKKVTIIEWIERRKLQLLYKESNLFLFPSHEGAGMVVSEALSHGLPVVCFDNCGPGEFVTSECGLVVPYGSYNDTVVHFSKHLKTLFLNKELYNSMSKASKKRFDDYFHWDKKGEDLKKIYENI